ncbi:hypothetical protein [Flaviramulus basaltis]|uniref:hypothetical protein n=1 Tax=Flaviramulus basaltis TaxID=369401 RepID=UPI0015C52EAB|nr:hypothetical protein [Flaviramulus basaltis]
MTQRILKDPFAISNQGKFTYPKDLDNALSKELNEKKIKWISVGVSSECKTVEYGTEYEYPIGTLHLTWTTCDPKQTERGFYQSDSSFIEIYGIGNNWLIWTDGDPI